MATARRQAAPAAAAAAAHLQQRRQLLRRLAGEPQQVARPCRLCRPLHGWATLLLSLLLGEPEGCRAARKHGAAPLLGEAAVRRRRAAAGGSKGRRSQRRRAAGHRGLIGDVLVSCGKRRDDGTPCGSSPGLENGRRGWSKQLSVAFQIEWQRRSARRTPGGCLRPAAAARLRTACGRGAICTMLPAACSRCITCPALPMRRATGMHA